MTSFWCFNMDGSTLHYCSHILEVHRTPKYIFYDEYVNRVIITVTALYNMACVDCRMGFIDVCDPDLRNVCMLSPRYPVIRYKWYNDQVQCRNNRVIHPIICPWRNLGVFFSLCLAFTTALIYTQNAYYQKRCIKECCCDICCRSGRFICKQYSMDYYANTVSISLPNKDLHLLALNQNSYVINIRNVSKQYPVMFSSHWRARIVNASCSPFY